MNTSRVKWQCRRGMLELDILLQDFVDEKYGLLTDKEKNDFDALLKYPDQNLQDYFYGRATPIDAGIADIVSRIRKPTLS
jgi:antitoxin CptB